MRARIVIAAAICLATLRPSRAERLPIRAYSSEDGLGSDRVIRIIQDSNGYLWFATTGGLSRFDGYRFSNYAVSAPDRIWVRDILQKRDGSYWVATTRKGVCRFDPSPAAQSRFTCYLVGSGHDSNYIYRIYEDRNGSLWAGTGDGLFVAERGSSQPGFKPVALPSDAQLEVHDIVQDSAGAFWLGTDGHGLYRLRPGRPPERFDGPRPLAYRALLINRAGRLLAATNFGLALIAPDPRPGESAIERFYTTTSGLGAPALSLDLDAEGTIWCGSADGLLRLRGDQLKLYNTAHGLPQSGVNTIAHDSEGNLWLGVGVAGAVKIANTGFTSFGENDGLATDRIRSLIDDQAGRLCAIDQSGSHLLLSCFDGERFHTIVPAFPPAIDDLGWGHGRIVLQDHTSDWWWATARGVVRFPKAATFDQLARTPPKAVYNQRNGLLGNEVFRLFEDSRGDIWLSTLDGGVSRWKRKSDDLERFSSVSERLKGVSGFAEDRDGNIWMALYSDGLARYRDGGFTFYGQKDGIPQGLLFAIDRDDSGTLWGSSGGGLIAVEEPDSSQPRFRGFTVADGLASDFVLSTAPDGLGHLYIGTDRGLDRMDLKTHEIRHYSIADGLASIYVAMVHRDRQGNLWFGSNVGGLSRLAPRPDPPRAAHPVHITGVRIGGQPNAISELGATDVSGIRLQPGRNQFEVEFAAIHLRAGDVVRYQYMLEPADSTWSAPGQQRSVNYANLASGRYRFLARAVDDIGSVPPATIEFVVDPHLWQRWWFITAFLAVTAAGAYQAHRYRMARVLELERVRMRIATDLHDDIGSSLSQIALLSEVARREMNGHAREVEPLARIGELSRELVDNMSDVVWSIHPHRDAAADVVHRMRRFANDICGAQGIELEFRTFGFDSDTKLGADLRRQVYLIFKESVHNLVRHAGCQRATIIFNRENGWLTLEVSDDGVGAAEVAEATGHGLASMRARAARLGGELTIEAAPGRGSKVTLRIPVKSPPVQVGRAAAR